MTDHLKICADKSCRIKSVDVIPPPLRWEYGNKGEYPEYPLFPVVTDIIVRYLCGLVRIYNGFNANITMIAATPPFDWEKLLEKEEFVLQKTKFVLSQEYYKSA